MHSNYFAITILLALVMGLLLFARWFDRRFYIPFLNETFYKHKKQPVYQPSLLGVGLLAACGGLFIWSLIGAVCIWIFHK